MKILPISLKRKKLKKLILSILFFSTTDIDEVWDQSDWIISFSGENITDISEKKKIKKTDIKYFISGIKTK